MSGKEWKTAEGIFEYELEEESVVITGYKGSRMELSVPPQIDGKWVRAIGRKAFFNTCGIFRIYLPETLTKIDDWAFAHCKDLEEVWIFRRKYELGKSLFMECGNLKSICLIQNTEKCRTAANEAEILTVRRRMDRGEEAAVRGFGTLLASVCGILDAPYLFQTEHVDDAEWLSLWDNRMFTILHSDDMDGYTNLLLCGEEDYGSRENNLDFFLEEKRRRKVRLAFLRLLYDKGLADADRRDLTDYLKGHTKGCESEETWLVLKEEHGDDMEYIALFLELSCLTLDNFDDILKDLDGQHAQMTAYFIRYKEQHLGNGSFFDSLSLD